MQSLAVVTSNQLLRSLSRDTRARLAPCLDHVTLSVGNEISGHASAVNYMYFPIDCIVSLVNATEDRGSTEVSVVGNEGALGVSLFLGGPSSSQSIVQCAGSALRLHASQVTREFLRRADFMVLMLRYTQSLINQIAQTAVCNRLHKIDEQLCRWLLDAHDRLPGNELEITHASIAGMLGVRREGVTGAAAKLQAKGAIACTRGRIAVLDRKLLEQLSCECYSVVKREHERLLPPVSEAQSIHADSNPSRCPTCGARKCGHQARMIQPFAQRIAARSVA